MKWEEFWKKMAIALATVLVPIFVNFFLNLYSDKKASKKNKKEVRAEIKMFLDKIGEVITSADKEKTEKLLKETARRASLEVEERICRKNLKESKRDFSRSEFKYEKLVNKCQEEKRMVLNELQQIVNKSYQLDIILTQHEFTEECREKLIEKSIPFKKWMEKKEVRKKLNEIFERKEKCKDCSTCNNLSYFPFLS